MTPKKLWSWLAAVIIASFAVLIYYGVDIYRKIPPIPDKVTTTDGQVLYTGHDVKDGQNVWQSIGGQTVGSIWGHGAYIAPDWTADYLHREATLLLNELAKKDGKIYHNLPDEEQAKYKTLLQKELRTNTFDEASNTIVISPERAKVQRELAVYYKKLFMGDPSMAKLRDAYAIPANTIKDIGRMEKMNAFFAWSTWVCITSRPGDKVTYTNNWPHDELVGNTPPSSLHMWSGFSVLMLLACLGILVLYHARNKDEEIKEELPLEDPLRNMKPTPSMKATLKYIWVVALLILVQMLAGVITAHYGVEGSAFYGILLDQYLPQSVSRSWHVQLAIFWIATSWLATGLYIAPAVSGYEPKYQKLGVNVLFGALLIVVLGSLTGQWLGVMQKLGLVDNFLWGHQGYEYIELGRIWQILLLVGLILWLILMLRALMPALKRKDENRHMLTLFVLASVAIAMFYG
ncbi:cbb3-type cytochrome c oxidase subunit I, partial [Elizabethkingia meningoseptica]|uniref:cbb3-type cytochrome c oxidase subunit I n=1 Tax=Elizabethkingia meningoseptica TaxID=238 RepID=UPI0023AF5531